MGYRQQGEKVYELRESEIARKRAEIGMVFQQFNLFPHMTALGNVTEAPIRVQGERKAEAEEAPGSCSSASASPTRSTSTRPASPAASSSAWRSPGRWR